jgi:5'-methylthioadenosine phosphorylase
MPAIVACIAGEEVYRQWDAGLIAGQRLGSRSTPFGPSSEVFQVTKDDQSFYLLPRYGPGMAKVAPSHVNYRANLYALKDLGVQGILSWGPGGAITHSLVGRAAWLLAEFTPGS